MAIQIAQGPDEAVSSINTTPLVDVMLVLLIIFLITIPVVNFSVPVELPHQRNEVRESQPKDIVITVSREGRLYFGIGYGKLGMIDLRDTVECAESCVISDAYDDQVFTLTGPESIGFHHIASRLNDILGRPVQYIPVPPEAVERSIRAMGMGEWYAQVMRDLCRAYSENWGDLITDSLARITGRAPRSFDVFAREVLLPALVAG